MTQLVIVVGSRCPPDDLPVLTYALSYLDHWASVLGRLRPGLGRDQFGSIKGQESSTDLKITQHQNPYTAALGKSFYISPIHFNLSYTELTSSSNYVNYNLLKFILY